MIFKVKKIFRGTPLHLSKLGRLNDSFAYLMINLPFICNYHCLKCFNLVENNFHVKGDPICVDKIFALIDEAKDMNGKMVILAGEGEPSLNSDIKKIIQKIDSVGMLTVIYSNGSVLTDELIDFYAQHNVSLVISFDSLPPALYLKLTGNRDINIFRRVLKNIERAREVYMKLVQQEGDYLVVRLAINTTVTSLNKNEVEKIKNYCGDDMYFICNPIAKLGNAINHWNELLQSDDDYQKIEHIVRQMSETTGPLTLGSDGLCGYSSNGIAVSPSGNYMTCAYTSLTDGLLGNIFNRTLTDAYNYKKVQERHFYETYGNCPCLVRSSQFSTYLQTLKSNLTVPASIILMKIRRKAIEKNTWCISTCCVHSGERNKRRQHHSITTPIEQTATYYWDSSRQIEDFYNDKAEGIKYGRYGNTTQQVLEHKLAELEGADTALVFSSGMNALTTAILSLVGKGKHIVYLDECYRNTRTFFDQIVSSFGISATPIPFAEIENLGKYIQKNSVLFFAEVPTNPFLRVLSLKNIVHFCRANKLIFLIDSSFASPVNLRPLEYGVDMIIHSATKYLGGHNDIFAGVVAGKREFTSRVQEYRNIFGGMLGPMESFLLLRSLKTLALRMKQHNENGMLIAEYFASKKIVQKIWYPGLDSHPDYQNAKEQMLGFGGVITVALDLSEEQTSSFVNSLNLFYHASNFGGGESLIEQHALLTFYKDRDSAAKRGITGNVLRLSIGIEDVRDLIKDLEQAFKKI